MKIVTHEEVIQLKVIFYFVFGFEELKTGMRLPFY